MSNEVAREALSLANAQIQLGLPPILTLGHLAQHVGIPTTLLYDVVKRYEHHYKVYFTRKKNGSARMIHVPQPFLCSLQRWINAYILQKATMHPRSYAYKVDCDIVECAKQHCGAKTLIKMDIKDYFPSITEERVYSVYREFGYSRLVAFQLARLSTTTLSHERHPRPSLLQKPSDKLNKYPFYKNNWRGFLPQGSPTSPMFSNLVSRRMDAAIEALCQTNGHVYTRYADDVTISSASVLDRADILRVRNDVYHIMKSEQFLPNYAKFKIIPSGARKIVLGLLVDGATPRLSKEFRKRLERHLHYLTTSGPVAHTQACRFDSHLGMRNHVLGLLNFAQHVDAGYCSRLWQAWNGIQWPEPAA